MRLVRVFVSSPSDCSTERTIVEEVVLRINRFDGERVGLKLETFAWENNVVPQIGPPPQKVVDDQTPICDVFVGIMSGRLGGDETRDSGTEQEFQQALQRFGDTGQPWILFYFNDNPERATTAKACHDRARVLEFKESLEKKGIVGTYEISRGTPKGFFEQIEPHLRNLLYRPEFGQRRAARRKTSGRTGPRQKSVTARSTANLRVPKTYTDWIKAETASPELFGLGAAQDRTFHLGSVYVPLLTSAFESGAGTGNADTEEKRENPRLLLHALGARSLYVSGAPGAGKSTFCRWVAWLVANGAMPPADFEPPEPLRESMPPSLCDRLAVLVPLREFCDALPKRTGRSLSPSDLAATISRWLHDRTGTAGDIDVHRFLAAGRALLLFDGVDEVPTSDAGTSGRSNPRQLLLNGLSRAVESWVPKGNRVLVTSRPYGLTDPETKALGLHVAPITDLTADLQRLLTRRWFRIEKKDATNGDASASQLMQDVAERRWLQPLAANPLMLTAMCAIYNDGGKLPQDRHQLYERIVQGMLTKRYDDPFESIAVRGALCAVAHAMHTGEALGLDYVEPLTQATFKEAELALRNNPHAAQPANAVGAGQMLTELLARSGLLVARTNQTLAFYHSSIQEFLAAQRILDSRYSNLAAVFARRAGVPGWRNTLSFLFARYADMFTLPAPPLTLLRDLIDSLDATQLMPQLVVGECAEMLLAKGYVLEKGPAHRLRERLFGSMTTLSARRERCDAGTMLGKIGDPRFDADRWFLPITSGPTLGFVRVSAGRFLMGSDPTRDKLAYEDEQPQHTIDLHDYFIGRYPVTVAQFRAYVEDSGVAPQRARCLSGPPNHPVVLVSWHEALDYCKWLTEKLRAWAKAPRAIARWLDETVRNGWDVMLPTEAEWEKAARGTDGRTYPWGDKFDEERANTSMQSPSAVGAFPAGASPFDVMDMCGNVWEWTRSLWGPPQWTPKFSYPYDAALADRELLTAPDSICRVARGGSFDYPIRSARAANRSKGGARQVYSNTGFRLVVTLASR